MSLLIKCANCGSHLKAPDRLAGRSVRCLKCKAPIEIPTHQATPSAVLPEVAQQQPQPVSPPLPVAELLAVQTGASSTAWLTALLLTGAGVAFFLVIALLVILLNRPTASSSATAPNLEQQEPRPNKADAPATGPMQPLPAEPTLPPPLPDRPERLAFLEAQEQAALAPLAKLADDHKAALQKLAKEEDSLFGKVNLKAAAAAKLKVRTDLFVKDQTAAIRPVIKDLAALTRKREEHLQAKRKLLYDHPQAGDPKLEEYGGLVLTPDEIKDLVQREAQGSTPRAVALSYVKGPEAAAVVTAASYAGTFQNPDDADLVAVSYRATYRGRADQQVHVFLLRWRGSWLVPELPGRKSGVLMGPPPNEYKRVDGGL